MDHLNFMEVTLNWSKEQMTIFRDAYLEEKQLRRSEVTEPSNEETRVVAKAFRSHQSIQSTSQASRDLSPTVEEVEDLTPTLTNIQEALDKRSAELQRLEADLKQ